MKIHRTDQEVLYRGKIVDLVVDEVRYPSGKTGVREIVRHPGGAVVVPLLQDGAVLLVRQHRYPLGEEILELGVQRRALTAAQRAVGRLDGELSKTNEVSTRFVEGAFRHLQERDAVEGVSLGLLQTADLCAEALGDREPGGVVGCARNAQTR